MTDTEALRRSVMRMRWRGTRNLSRSEREPRTLLPSLRDIARKAATQDLAEMCYQMVQDSPEPREVALYLRRLLDDGVCGKMQAVPKLVLSFE